MRIVETLLRVLMIGPGLGAGLPAIAFDGKRTEDAMASAPALAVTPMDAFRSGARWLKAGEPAKAVNSLEYAAENGHALAQWKLGRMYADGEGGAGRATISRRSTFPAASPTAMPRTIQTRRRRASSPTPSSRSATIISTASRRRGG